MNTSYSGRDYSYASPHARPELPRLSPFIAALVLVTALLCIVASGKRKAAQKPAPKPSPSISDYDREAELIREHRRTLELNKQRRTITTPPNGAQLWQ